MLLVAEPVLGKEEQAALADVIDSGWITMGSRVREFERAFADMHSADDCVAVSSCTAALHLALAALEIGPGDEVLVPSMTFVATANAVLYVGAKPVFVDIESLDSPLISLADAESKCSERTRAVILMHFAGALCDAESWRSFARKKGLFLIEDTAHAVAIKGAGVFGDAAAFSFYGNKNMTTAEGGVVFAKDPAVLARARQMRGHGLTSGTFERMERKSSHYDVTMLGFNYRMDELRAAIGLTQLSHVHTWNERRRQLAETYRKCLVRMCPEVVSPLAEHKSSAHHIMPILLPEASDRDAVAAHLRDHGIQTTMHYPPVHQLSFYRTLYPDISLPITEAFGERELTLPLHPRVLEEQVESVIIALAAALTK